MPFSLSVSSLPHFSLYETACKRLFFARDLCLELQVLADTVHADVIQSQYVQNWIPPSPVLSASAPVSVQRTIITCWRSDSSLLSPQTATHHTLLIPPLHFPSLSLSPIPFTIYFSAAVEHTGTADSRWFLPALWRLRFISRVTASGIFFLKVGICHVASLKPMNGFPCAQNKVWTPSCSLYGPASSGPFVSPIIILLFLSVLTILAFYLLWSPHSPLPLGLCTCCLLSFSTEIVTLQVRKLSFRKRKWLTCKYFICLFIRKYIKSQSTTETVSCKF